jgi:hypothetical protein
MPQNRQLIKEGFYADRRGQKDKGPITVSGHSPKSSSIIQFFRSTRNR